MRILANGDRLEVRDCRDNPFLLRSFSGYRAATGGRHASLPLVLDAIDFLREEWPKADIDASVGAAVARRFAPTPATSPPPASPVPPFAHQAEAVERAAHLPRFALLFEMGTGKTKTAIDIARWKHLHLGVRRVLVVAPIAVHEHWRREIAMNCVERVDVRIVLGGRAQRRELLNRPTAGRFAWWVINYEALRLYVDALRACRFEMVIADESTRIKNERTQQHRALRRIAEGVEHRLILTGTPIWNRPEDVFGQYRFLDPFLFGECRTQFFNQFLSGRQSRPEGARTWPGLRELRRRMFAIGMRKTKAECLDLPPRVRQVRRVRMTTCQERLYRAAETACRIAIRRALKEDPRPRAVVFQNILARLVKLQQIAGGHVKDETGEIVRLDCPKREELATLLAGELADKKVIVWSRFKEDLRRLHESLGDGAVAYHGDLSRAEAERNLTRFRRDRNVRVFLGQVHKGGMGIDLSVADTAVFFTNDWSPGIREQAESRNHRRGSERHRSVTYIDLVCEGTIDEDVLVSLKEKREVMEVILERMGEDPPPAGEESETESPADRST